MIDEHTQIDNQNKIHGMVNSHWGGDSNHRHLITGTRKAALYTRLILNEIGIDQTETSTLFIDNIGVLLMENAQQPTRRTQHMDNKRVSHLDCVERDLIIMRRITTSDNSTDTMTKALGQTLFY